MLEKRKIPNHTNYDYYNNGIDGSVSKDKANAIIEEIIDINEKGKNNCRNIKAAITRYNFIDCKRNSNYIVLSNILRKASVILANYKSNEGFHSEESGAKT